MSNLSVIYKKIKKVKGIISYFFVLKYSVRSTDQLLFIFSKITLINIWYFINYIKKLFVLKVTAENLSCHKLLIIAISITKAS